VINTHPDGVHSSAEQQIVTRRACQNFPLKRPRGRRTGTNKRSPGLACGYRGARFLTPAPCAVQTIGQPRSGFRRISPKFECLCCSRASVKNSSCLPLPCDPGHACRLAAMPGPGATIAPRGGVFGAPAAPLLVPPMVADSPTSSGRVPWCVECAARRCFKVAADVMGGFPGKAPRPDGPSAALP
jgi:hypothetical protein